MTSRSPRAPAAPDSPQGAAAALASAEGPVRLYGAGSKRAWSAPPGEGALELSTRRLDTVVSHDAGDLTAVLQAGVPLALAQERFAAAGQMLALDPPDGGATIGGVVASGDSGPLRGRYGAPRDLVLGVTVALSDGTLARAGGRVIKNVAGYDLAKLFAGSRGTLGLIVEVAVRLHPRPTRTVTTAGGTTDAAVLAAAAASLAHAPLEHEGFDVRWGGGDGALLVRFGGVRPEAQAARALELMQAAGLSGQLVEEDAALWEAQRAGQRSESGAVMRVSGTLTELAPLAELCTRLGLRLVGRAGLGIHYVRVEDRPVAEMVSALHELQGTAPCTLLDAPPEVRAELDSFSGIDDGALALMRRVKERFDPEGKLV